MPAAPPNRPAQPSPVVQVPPPPVPQQGCPMPPQVPQVLPLAAVTHPSGAWQAMLPLQQGCPAAPHGWQLPLFIIMSRPAQARPIWQLPLLPPPQQGWPMPPQVPQRLPAALRKHPSPISQLVPSLQQG